MKRIRKSICCLLVICMLATMLPMSVFAESSEIACGTCGDNLTWVLTEDGTLTISGEGDMDDYLVGSTTPFASWYDYREYITVVIVEDGVTSIGDYAFNYYYSNISNVTLSNTVTNIGDQAFCYCRGLMSINIPDSVTEIEWYALYGCSSLETIVLSSGMSKIAAHVFDNCNSLESVQIPDSITTIDGTAFDNCSSMTTICGLTGSYAETWAVKNGYEFIAIGSIETPKDNDTDPDDETDSESSMPMGTAENPYQIASAEDLDAVRNDLGAYYIQTCDIDLVGYENWIPIGDTTNAFTGEYDGAGYSISGLNISSTDTGNSVECIGLFGKSTGVIKNVNLVTGSINTSVCCTYVGSIAGYATSISNCSSRCNIQATCQYGGGIAGYAESVSECKYYGNAEFKDGAAYSYSYFGGISGKSEEINTCYNGGILNSTVNWYYSYLGGIAGYLTGTANQCVNSGILSCINNIGRNGSGSTYTAYVGGISGLNGRGSCIQNSYNYGDIYGSGYSAMLGGISSQGGSGSIYKYCYNKGEITYSSYYPYRGGIIGSAYGYGSSYDTQYIYSCYWNSDYSCAGSNVWQPKVIYKDSNYGPIEDVAFMSRDAFVGFDFENIWEFGGGESYPYPTLKTLDYSTIISPGIEGDGTFELSITGLTINKEFNNFYIYIGDSHVYNMDSPNAALYLELNQITVVDNDVISPADITWTSSDESVLRVISSGGVDDVYVNLRLEGLSEGTATLTAMNPDGETISFDVTVVKPNALSFTKKYGTEQYYYAGAFYSTASMLSDSVEIYVEFANEQIEGYPCKVEEELTVNVSDVAPITLTATVSGSDLSFERSNYQNTYTATYTAIEFGSSVYDLLTLFPVDGEAYDVPYGGLSYTVEVTLMSDSFEAPLTETYSFTIYNAESSRVVEHQNFIDKDRWYQISKQNFYGENMMELKSDGEYQWSKWSSFDFENYYEVVLADILVGMLDVDQAEFSIMPTVLKDWYGTYKTLLDGITSMVNDSYSEIMDVSVSEMKIDKLIKASKYKTKETSEFMDDDLYIVVLDLLGNENNTRLIQNVFSLVDKGKQVFGLVKLTGNLVKDFVAWGNTVCVMNAFLESDEEFKQIFREIDEAIPDSEEEMKEAIEDYLNFSSDYCGYIEELHESFAEMQVDVTLDLFKGFVGKEAWDWLAVKVIQWIGYIPIGTDAAGAKILLSSTSAYTTAMSVLSTAVGSVSTGITLGLCLSDLICDSEDKAAEMGKIIAMSEYAPYIIQVLENNEENLRTSADNHAVDLFEKAFELHKASQRYIMEHTAKALEVKAESLLSSILGHDDYDELVANILVQKKAIDSMECCGSLTGDTIVYTTKVIAVKCPVDVYIYNEAGSEVVCVIDDVLQFAEDGITVYTRDHAKYIALPANQTYSVKIVATDEGTMEYVVMEFGEDSQLYRTVQEQEFLLVNGRTFTGEVVAELDIEETSYTLTYFDGVIGDVDCDGEISDWDAILLNRYLAGWDVDIDLAVADVDGDGEVSDWDAIILERFLAGWDVEFTTA